MRLAAQTTLKPQTEMVTVRVPVQHEEKETYQVPVTETALEKEVYHVQVPDVRPEVRTRTVKETVYKTVPEVVTERIPVTTCVKVPYQVQVRVPCECP